MKFQVSAACAAILLVGTSAYASGQLRLGINNSQPIAIDASANIQLTTPELSTNRRLRLELAQPVLCTSFATTTTDVGVDMVDPQNFSPYPTLRGFGSMTYQVNDTSNQGFVRLSSIGGPSGENALACCILTPSANAACLQGSRIQGPIETFELFGDGFEDFVPVSGPDLVVTVQAPATIQAGEQVIYTITITNEGPLAATSARIREYAPISANVSPTLTVGTWTCAATGAGSSCGNTSGSGLISSVSEQNLNIAAGGSITYTVTRMVVGSPVPTPGSQLRLQAAAFSRPADNESRIGNNQGEALVTIVNNTPPTISDVGNQVINEDTPTGTLSVTIADTQTSGAGLSLTATSSNTAVVPNGGAGLTLGGSGNNRNIVVTPAQDAVGSSTITLIVSDGSLTATDTFVVTVSQVNDPPSFTAGADQVFTSHASGLVTALPDPWATAISPCPPSRPTCVGNEGTQNVTLSIANVSDPDDILSGTGPGQVSISSTTGTMSYFFNDDGGNPGFAPEGVVCFDVVATDDGTPPQSATVQNVKIEVGNGTGSCIPSDQDN
ncbi:MAG: hypothetical protein R3F15_06290 [Lysobacterales bacterium]